MSLLLNLTFRLSPNSERCPKTLPRVIPRFHFSREEMSLFGVLQRMKGLRPSEAIDPQILGQWENLVPIRRTL